VFYGIEALIYAVAAANTAAEAAAAARERQYYDAEPFDDVIDVEARVVPDVPLIEHKGRQ
jgi:hypothetical protein